MKYHELKNIISQNIFSVEDVVKHFHDEHGASIRTQLARFTVRKLIFRIKRSLYCFDLNNIDELELANTVYKPSYVSCESALNYYGIIPDVPQSVTSITTTTSKTILTSLGAYHYFKVHPKLYFGFDTISYQNKSIHIAKKEKALLDYLYIRKIKSLKDLRLSLTNIDTSLYFSYAKQFAPWVQKISL